MTHHSVAMPAQATRVTWSATFWHSLAFVLGFTLVFTLLGSAVGLIGRNITPILPTIQRIGAVLLVLFGLVTIGVVQWLLNVLAPRATHNPALALLMQGLHFINSLLYTERRVQDVHQVKRGLGYVSSLLMGVSFSAGWVPCVGPILASILFLASDSTTVTAGALLLLLFGLGLGLPFLITGAAFSTITPYLRRINRHLRIISYVSGVFLFLLAYFLWTDRLTALTGSFGALNALALEWEESITQALGLSFDLDASFLASAPLAIIAGMIGFFSPCVLPLIPAYIGYLSGTSLGRDEK